MALEREKVINLIGNLIQNNKLEMNKALRMYNRYTLRGVPIKQRTFEDKTKINHQLINDFVGEIVRTKVGYMGKFINYNIDKDSKNYNDINKAVQKWNLVNHYRKTDAETIKKMSLYGYCAKLLYIAKDGSVKQKLLEPFKFAYIENKEEEVEYFVRIIEEIQIDKNTNKKTWEFYDNENIYTITYVNDIPVNNFIVQKHLFNKCPIIIFKNNEEKMSDIEAVIDLIDAYDKTLSDWSSELEQFRLAYMIFKGFSLEPEDIEKLKRSGGFEIQEGQDVSFLTKQINVEAITKILEKFDENISRFAQHMNFNDKNFAGNLSGVAIKYKTYPFETKCMLTEIEMEKSLRLQWELISYVWNLNTNLNFDYTDLYFKFKRNTFDDLLAEADKLLKLKGVVSEETMLTQASFVDDVDYEIKRIKEQESQ